MPDVTINFRANNETTRPIGDLQKQLESLRGLLAEGVTTAIENSLDAFSRYPRAVLDTRDHIAGLAEAQAVLNGFWREASGQLPDYASEIARVNASVIDLGEAERALSAAVASNVDLISVAIDGEREKTTALESAVAAYERAETASRAYEVSLLDSASAAIEAGRRIESVARTINDADPSRAEARLRDYDNAFQLTSVSVPRLTSAMRDFTGTLSPANNTLQTTTRELENLSSAAREAARDAEFLNASVADIQAFDPRTPGRASQGFDFQSFGIQQAERLASAGIGLAGDLRRAEENRLESIEDLERETSERILRINERKAERLGRISQRIEQEELERIASIEKAFEDAKDAEIAARQEAADAIVAIQEDAVRAQRQVERELRVEIRELEADLFEDIARIREDFVEREGRRQQEIVEITERAVEQRLSAEARYEERVIETNRDLVETVRGLRADLADRLASLDAGLLEREASRAAELVEIERDAAAARIASEERYEARVIEINRNLVRQVQGLLERRVSLESDLVDRLSDLASGLAAREAERAAELVGIERDAAESRIAAQARYAQRVIEINQGINRELVRQVQDRLDAIEALERDLADRLSALDAGLVARQASRAAEFVEIERDAVVGRLAAHERYEARVIEINRDLVNAVRGLQSDLSETLSELDNGFLARQAERAEALLDIEADVADQRVDVQERYRDRVAEINRGLVESVRDVQAEILEVESEIGRIASEIADIESEASLARAGIVSEAADARRAAEGEYAENVQDIYNDLAREITSIERDLTRRLDGIRDRRFEAEQDRITALGRLERETRESSEDRQLGLGRDIQDVLIENNLRDDLSADTLGRAFGDQDVTDTRGILGTYDAAVIAEVEALRRGYFRDIEDIERESGRERIDIAEGVAREQADLNRQELEAIASGERARAEAEAGVDAETALANAVPALTAMEQAALSFSETIAGIDADEVARLEGIETQAAEDIAAATQRRLALEAEITEHRREILSLETEAGVTFSEALANLVPEVDASTEALINLNAALAEIDADAASRRGEIAVAGDLDRETTDARRGEAITQTDARISELEADAGLTFEEALSNFVPELDLSTRALNAFNAALASINTNLTAGRADIAAAGVSDRGAVDAEREGLISETGASIAELDSEIAQLESEAGRTFEEALANLVPEVDASTRALNAFNAALASINRNLAAGRADIAVAGAADRASVETEREALISETASDVSDIDARISELEAGAGITFEEALANFVPEVDASTRALNEFNTTLAEISADAATRRGGVLAAGAADRGAVATERASAISGTDTRISELEAAAGITFVEALATYVPALDATTQALVDLNTSLEQIGSDEATALAVIAAAGALDRTDTDAAVDARQGRFDADARDAELDAQGRIIDIEFAAFQEIQDVNVNLKLELAKIDATLSEILAAIRENKIEFDTAIFAEIREIERESAAELAEVRSDAAAMRAELEAIAQEAKDNAWKKGLLKMANVGITIAGVAAGAVIAGPAGAAAGAQIGAALGGLVEQGGDELFHSPQHDLLAFRSGQQARRGRNVAFSPNATQRQNAEDFSRYFGEGYASERGSGSEGVSERPVVIQLVMNDRVLQEMSVRLSELRGQDRIV